MSTTTSVHRQKNRTTADHLTWNGNGQHDIHHWSREVLLNKMEWSQRDFKGLSTSSPSSKTCFLTTLSRRYRCRLSLCHYYKNEREWQKASVPLNMKVIDQGENVLYVNPFQWDEGCQVISLKDSLSLTNTARPVPSTTEEPYQSTISTISLL